MSDILDTKNPLYITLDGRDEEIDRESLPERPSHDGQRRGRRGEHPGEVSGVPGRERHGLRPCSDTAMDSRTGGHGTHHQRDQIPVGVTQSTAEPSLRR